MKMYETPAIKITEIKQQEIIMVSALTTSAGGKQTIADSLELKA